LHALRLTPSPSSTPQSAQLIDCIVNAVWRECGITPTMDVEARVIAAAVCEAASGRERSEMQMLRGPGADRGFAVLKQHNDIFAFTPCCSLDC
jgi:hypothetical protein